MRVTVMKWDEYQPRKDVKKSSWFRMEHGLLLSTKYLGLTMSDIFAFTYVLSLCSEENSKTIEIIPEHVAIFGRMKEQAFSASIVKLEGLSLLRVECTDKSRPRHGSASLRTNEQDERTNDNTSSEPSARPPGSELFPVLSVTKVDGAMIGDETLTEFSEVRESLRGRVKITVQRKWLELYSQEFVVRKVKELDLWCLNNPHKAPRSNWSAFYTKCMGKDWEKFRTTLPSNKPGNQQLSYYAQQQEQESKRGTRS